MNTLVHYTPRKTHPIVIIAAIALILLSAAGVAAIMGWLPAAHSSDATGTPTATSSSASSTKPSANAPTHAVAAPKPADNMTADAGASVRTCQDCGNIEAITPIEVKGQSSGAGAVIGGLLGGVLGHQIGGGRGKDLTTAAGAVGGALAGNEVERNRNTTTSYKVRVHLDNGDYRTITTAHVTGLQTGDRVRIAGSSIERMMDSTS